MSFAFSLLLLALADSPSLPIVLDGKFDDWRDTSAVITDPTGDAHHPDGLTPELDLEAVHAIADGRFLHLRIGLGNVVNVQRLDGSLQLLLNADGEDATGSNLGNPQGVSEVRGVRGVRGADVVITFSPPNPERPGAGHMGVGLTSTTWNLSPSFDNRDDSEIVPLTPYDIGFTFAPTFANDEIEVRIERGSVLPNTAAFLRGKHCTIKLQALDKSGAVIDETDPFTIELPAFQPDESNLSADESNDPLAPPSERGLRVMSWNTRFGGLLSARERAQRIIRAVDPDVILLQEMPHTTSANQVREALRGSDQIDKVDERAWHILISSGGGDLRSAIASRFPLAPAPGMEPLAYPDWPDRQVRTCAAIIEVGDRHLLAVSAHLKCCGRIGDDSDEKRIVESGAINEAVAKLVARSAIDGIIIAGDFNLVGSDEPLAIARRAIDLDGTDLLELDPLQIDQRSNATWQDREQPFVPGRLDFILISDAALKPMRSFVLDTRDLSPALLAKHKLQADDAIVVSDHFPIIADLDWTESNRAPAREE